MPEKKLSGELQSTKPPLALQLSPPAAMNQAMYCYNNRDWEKAEYFCRFVLGKKSDYFDALNLLGAITAQTQRLPEATNLLRRATAVQPNNEAAHNNLGNALKELKQYQAAIESYKRAIAIKPNYADAYLNHGLALKELGELRTAADSFEKAISINPNLASAHFNRGNTMQGLKQLDAAVISYNRAIAINSNYADAYCNRGIALYDLNQLDAAIASYNHAIAINPNSSEAHFNRANALLKLRLPEAALASLNRVINLKPNYAEAYFNRGVALQELQQTDAAIASYKNAISIKPDYAEVYNNLGNCLQKLREFDAAIASFDKAIAIKPHYAEAYGNRGNALLERNELEAALQNYDIAVSIMPNYEWLHGLSLHTRLHVCDWLNYAENRLRLIDGINSRKKIGPSFVALDIDDDPALQRKAAEIWVDARHPVSNALGPFFKKPKDGKIRLGYYSADFRNHAVSHLMAGVFEHHDRDQFELIAFSFGTNISDAMRDRIATAFDQFIDVHTQNDRAVAELSRTMGIDIAIDLGGHTDGCRTGIFALRAAPIQVNYLGYPATMGANYIDYIIGDKQVIPAAYADEYTEKVVFLPCFQANDNKKKIADRFFTRHELGLPESAFVFCCFNQNHKITPEIFDCWTRILGRVPNSVLWIFAEYPQSRENLSMRFKASGLDPGRLVFATRMDLPEYLARYKSADLFLDTIPFNAGTTASDALWAGLPLLTCQGRAFATRMASSLLIALGLPELVTKTQEQYEALAVSLATHPTRLKEIRQRLGVNRLTRPLFDTPRHTLHLETAYREMLQRYHAGLPTSHIHVADH